MEKESAIVPLTLLAVASGARSMIGLAAAARATNGRLARVATVAAVAELVGDKVPSAPNRTDPGPVAGRAVAGAIVGVVIAKQLDRNPVQYALVGAALALVGAQVTFRMRRALSERMPPLAAALVEDVVMIATASTGASALK